jgi:hypothetical protein
LRCERSFGSGFKAFWHLLTTIQCPSHLARSTGSCCQFINRPRTHGEQDEKNYVERTVCEENRRKIELFITEEGLSLLKEIDPIVDRTEEKMVGHFSQGEKEMFISLLNQVNFN